MRQHDDSAAIVINAHRILCGELPHDDPKASWNRPVPAAENTAQRMVDLITHRMPHHFAIRRPPPSPRRSPPPVLVLPKTLDQPGRLDFRVSADRPTVTHRPVE
ncbi:hypothetical protein [Streptomyces sp. Tue6028]|uniref:hypothetical protein n=1 Tax=Streptomyces sp. Tue6028 TaxID=2036037 RepID=UPI003D72B307